MTPLGDQEGGGVATGRLAHGDSAALPAALWRLDGRVVLFPVRHHSPTAARLLADLIRDLRPAHVLVEGPSDFNPQIGELGLPHRLPIAVYSWVKRADGQRVGAFYPFCVYSPEWQALAVAREVGAEARFIDLPYAALADDDARANRWSDAHLAGSEYVRMLAERLGVESFDDLWDTLVELDTTLTPGSYLTRVHHLCGHVRLLDGAGSEADQRREAFMAAQIASTPGRVVVVTGGWHSLALFERLRDGRVDPPADPPDPAERGIALTPYTYERLDALTGYDAGVPHPGFYDHLWHDRAAGRITHRALLARIARVLRERRQRVSSADLIAAEGCAQALARLRGHGEVWRTDLVDGIIGAWLKDDTVGGWHPFLGVVNEVLRGDAHGALAEGTSLPALVVDIRDALAQADLTPQHAPREVDLDLPRDRDRAALLHRLRVLAIAGFRQVDGTDFTSRDDLSRLFERWEIRWRPEYDASAVEAARYGPTLLQAAAACLLEQAAALERDAEKAAALLLDASLANLHETAAALHAQVVRLVRQDGRFRHVTGALEHLLYLCHFDEVLGTRGRPDLHALLLEAFARGLWLLETLGRQPDPDGGVVRGVRHLVDACERIPQVNRDELAEVLGRVQDDDGQDPSVRGAACGALWVLGRADEARVQAVLGRFAEPERLGDFLVGLFALARELFQREPRLLLVVDRVLTAYGEEAFLQALPSLRLAFTSFTPREKAHVAETLREAFGGPPLALHEVSVVDGVRMLDFERRLYEAAARWGVRT